MKDLFLRPIILLAAVLFGAYPAAQERGAARVLLAAVVDSRNRPIVALGADDFVVEEEGRPREVLDAHVADYPLAIVIDDGPDQGASFDAVRRAVTRFIERIGERPVAIWRLSEPDRPLAALDAERASVLRRVSELEPRAASQETILQAVANAARLLVDTGTPFAAVLVIAARTVDASQASRRELLPEILASGATIHALSGRVTTARDGASGDQDILRLLAEQARGQYTTIFSTASYAVALDRLADRLAAEMMIEYLVPKESTAADVRVGVRIPGAKVLGRGVSK